MSVEASKKHLRRYWAGSALGVFAGVLAVITPFWPDWIEAVSGWDPDQHDGSVEKYIAAALLVVAIALLAFAGAERRRWKTVTPNRCQSARKTGPIMECAPAGGQIE